MCETWISTAAFQATRHDPMSRTVVTPRTKQRQKTERPRLYKVILLNDDYTPREFVVKILRSVFRMSDEQAYHVMMTAHLAIEKLHAKLLAPLGPALEHARRAHEPVVVPDLDIDPQLVFPTAHCSKDPVLAGFGQDQPFGAVPLDRAHHLSG